MLTTKKFIKEVEKLGLEVQKYTNFIAIHYKGHQISYIYTDTKFYVGMTYEFSASLSEELQEKLYNLIDKYTRTPLDKREEPQKYYLRFTALTEIGDCNYLNYCATEETIYLSNHITKIVAQTQFTQKEIDEIREKFKVTLCDFEQIPVKEDEKKEWSEEE